MSTRIILADDHAIVREGLKSILENELGMTVVAQAESGRTAVDLALKLKPDIVIMDISMPDLNGIEATRRILSESAGVKVIALSMHSDKRYVAEMLKAGASGYLLKHSALDELERAIKTVLSDKTYVSPAIAGVVVKDYIQRLASESEGSVTLLTPKEREVLQLIAEGRSTKEIAGKLNVSVPTVESHRQHIMEKLDLHSVAELTKFAIREGLTSLE
ncbi:MAG: response regulator transcription factor [Ignavibacteriae bacterium]|nr:response regulator transcription factor [Ignavibacteria bacterium]MBI3364321.1 response regulator transcription factor [Ignavibacteriota bacterium]